MLEDTLYPVQIKLEEDALSGGAVRYRRLVERAMAKHRTAELKPVERLMADWLVELVGSIGAEKRMISTGSRSHGRDTYGKLLCSIPTQQLAVITLHEVLSATVEAGDSGVKWTSLAYAIGRSVVSQHVVRDAKTHPYKRRKVKEFDRQHTRREPKRLNHWAKDWLGDDNKSYTLRCKLGSCLLWRLVEMANVVGEEGEALPAFRIGRVRTGKNSPRYLWLRREAEKVIDDGHASRQYLRPKHLPMVVPPLPWTGDKPGGYLKFRTHLIRKSCRQQTQLLESASIETEFRAINAQASVPVRINKQILYLQHQVAKDGGGRLGIPDAENCTYLQVPPGVSTHEKQKLEKQNNSIWRTNRQRRQDRRLQADIFEAADAVADFQKLYYPQQIDFRGRLVPTPPLINWQGDDRIRGMLRFAEGKPNNDTGWEWLHVHCASMYGHDKLPFEDRIKWTEANRKEIVKAGNDPDSTDFWHHADGGDKPWQFLAACMEFARLDQDPRGLTYLPCQQDCTNNAIQHHAAVVRDPLAASLTNLLPSDAPVDGYLAVLDAVVEQLEKDAARGDRKAQILLPHLTAGRSQGRKLVKRPVMTAGYSVTVSGATKQITDVMESLGIYAEPWQHRQRWALARTLAKAAISATWSVMPALQAVKQYMETLATIVNESGEVFCWTSPTGLPVVQPYRSWGKQTVRTNVGKMRIIKPDDPGPPAKGRQKQGSIANGTHTWDAAHLKAVAIRSDQSGIHLLPVHDSCATHTVDTPAMRDIAIDEFVNLHERRLLDELHDELCERHPDLDFPRFEGYGDLDIQQVRKSRYMLS